MKGIAVIVKSTGEFEHTEFDGESPSLDFLRKAVGGHIETVPMFDMFEDRGVLRSNVVVFCNEEGKLTGLPYNETATYRWSLCIGKPLRDVLVGDIVVLYGDDEFMQSL